MNLLLWAKHNLRNIPPSIGKYLSLVPYQLRPGIGSVYRQRQSDIQRYGSLTPKERQSFIFQRFYDVLYFAYHQIPFYQKFYQDHNFNPEKLKSFDHIQDVPIMRKSDLNQIELEYRSALQRDRYITNTGGSSGIPLSFYIQSSFMGTEWAHMHHIWKQLDFKVSDMKLLFIGVGAQNNEAVSYDFVRNSFMINIYAQPEKVIAELLKIVDKYQIKYLHGYPSALHSFALSCKIISPELVGKLRKTLKGVFLNSEFPQPHFRNNIEEVFGAHTISWYGHTERCVLSHEKDEKFLFYPMQTYGFVEGIKLDTRKYQLVGTSYYNFASPFIRYNTGDEIENCTYDQSGILESYTINDGRSGEFILDKFGNRITLTGLIFGRHHRIFDFTSHVQVYQPSEGKAIILFVPQERYLEIGTEEVRGYFDTTNVEIDFEFAKIKAPYLTVSGKLNILITTKQFEEIKKI